MFSWRAIRLSGTGISRYFQPPKFYSLTSLSSLTTQTDLPGLQVASTPHTPTQAGAPRGVRHTHPPSRSRPRPLEPSTAAEKSHPERRDRLALSLCSDWFSGDRQSHSIRPACDKNDFSVYFHQRKNVECRKKKKPRKYTHKNSQSCWWLYGRGENMVLKVVGRLSIAPFFSAVVFIFISAGSPASINREHNAAQRWFLCLVSFQSV